MQFPKGYSVSVSHMSPQRTVRRRSGKLSDFLRDTKLTQGQLAERVGITQAHMSRVVHGGRIPSLALAVRLSRATGLPVESLLEQGS